MIFVFIAAHFTVVGGRSSQTCPQMNVTWSPQDPDQNNSLHGEAGWGGMFEVKPEASLTVAWRVSHSYSRRQKTMVSGLMYSCSGSNKVDQFLHYYVLVHVMCQYMCTLMSVFSPGALKIWAILWINHCFDFLSDRNIVDLLCPSFIRFPELSLTCDFWGWLVETLMVQSSVLYLVV